MHYLAWQLKVNRFATALLFAILAVVLAACAQQGDAPGAVQSYLQALVDKDRDRFIQLICPAYEADGMTEFDSLGAVEAELDSVTCRQTGTDGDFALVQCEGAIAVTYQGEAGQNLSLAGNTYRARQVDGEWKMCGYE
jgi:hypothetical protein